MQNARDKYAGRNRPPQAAVCPTSPRGEPRNRMRRKDPPQRKGAHRAAALPQKSRRSVRSDKPFRKTSFARLLQKSARTTQKSGCRAPPRQVSLLCSRKEKPPHPVGCGGFGDPPRGGAAGGRLSIPVRDRTFSARGLFVKGDYTSIFCIAGSVSFRPPGRY